MEVTDREMRQRFQIGTEEGPLEGLDVPPRGDGPEVDNCLFWFADGGYFSNDYPVGLKQRYSTNNFIIVYSLHTFLCRNAYF